ncbi:MAG TPA: hypothetical protein VF747_00290, partial [Blastocatellia bacterium]
MKTYGSFVIRCWLIRDQSQNERSVFDIEHIQSGEHKRAASLTEVNDWMMATCKTQDTRTEP